MGRSTAEDLEPFGSLAVVEVRLVQVQRVRAGRAVLDLAVVDLVAHLRHLGLDVGGLLAGLPRTVRGRLEGIGLLLRDLDPLARLRDQLLLGAGQITFGVLRVGDRALDERIALSDLSLEATDHGIGLRALFHHFPLEGLGRVSTRPWTRTALSASEHPLRPASFCEATSLGGSVVLRS